MRRRLRNVRKEKRLGGKGTGTLTNMVINGLTAFYGLPIRRNSDSIEKMRQALFATLDHCTSSDKKPKHTLCPSGEQSWCKWRRAEATGTLKTFKHKRVPLNSTVIREITPIYQELSSDDLLKRCLGVHTQNSNESLNSCSWNIALKHLHSGKSVKIKDTEQS